MGIWYLAIVGVDTFLNKYLIPQPKGLGLGAMSVGGETKWVKWPRW